MSLEKTPELYNDKELAATEISSALREGYLTLFIGAGVSKSATSLFLPWGALVEKCCKESGFSFDVGKKNQNRYLREVMEDIEIKLPEEDYIQLVKKCLYEGITYKNDILKKDLLVALGSIVMASIKGSAGTVVNYNFDDLLEWYLNYHGFKVQAISKIPTLVSKSDVKIYHPHGFLPLTDKYSSLETKNIIFSERSYLNSISAEVNPWNESQRSILSTKCALFIGMSGDDPHLESLSHYAYEKLLERKRIVGFVILKETEENKEKSKSLIKRGLVTYFIKDYDELPEILLLFCRLAAGL